MSVLFISDATLRHFAVRSFCLWLFANRFVAFSIEDEATFLLVYDTNVLRRHDNEFSGCSGLSPLESLSVTIAELIRGGRSGEYAQLDQYRNHQTSV